MDLGRGAVALVTLSGIAAVTGCRTPTEAVLDVTTDGQCRLVTETGVTAGLYGEIESAPFGARTDQCEGDGKIGSIVLLPPAGEKNAPFAFKVVTSLDAPLDECVAPDYGPSCIVVRRAMRFVPHDDFHVPIRMSQACAGVLCPEDQTCVAGVCASLTVDPGDCQDGQGDGCAPQAAVPPGFSRQIGGTGADVANRLALGSDGTIALTGSFEGTVDAGTGPLASRGGEDAFLAVYTPAGTPRWSRSFGGAQGDRGIAVTFDAQGSVYALLEVTGNVDFGAGVVKGSDATEVALVKLTSFGKLEWVVRFTSSAPLTAGRVEAHPSGDLVVSGSFTGSMKIGDQTLASAGGEDLFLARLTSAGDVVWARNTGGPDDQNATGLAVDGHGDLYLGGVFTVTADFGDGQPLAAAGKAAAGFLASFDGAGKPRWSRLFASPKVSGAVDDVAARDDRILVTGFARGTASLAGMSVDMKEHSGFLTAFDSSGGLSWVKTFAGSTSTTSGAADAGFAVSLATDGTVVLGGLTSNGAVFDKPVAGTKTSSPFVAVLGADGTVKWELVSASTDIGATLATAAPGHDYALVAGWFRKTLATPDQTFTSAGTGDAFFLRVAPP